MQWVDYMKTRQTSVGRKTFILNGQVFFFLLDGRCCLKYQIWCRTRIRGRGRLGILVNLQIIEKNSSYLRLRKRLSTGINNQ